MNQAGPPLSSTAESLLAPCPDTPNCVRRARTYPHPADATYEAVQNALEARGPARLTLIPEQRAAEAVYRVAFIFKDDVDVLVQSNGDESTVHIRSASRVGHNDLGVNRRRVLRLFEALDGTLSNRSRGNTPPRRGHG